MCQSADAAFCASVSLWPLLSHHSSDRLRIQSAKSTGTPFGQNRPDHRQYIQYFTIAQNCKKKASKLHQCSYLKNQKLLSVRTHAGYVELWELCNLVASAWNTILLIFFTVWIQLMNWTLVSGDSNTSWHIHQAPSEPYFKSCLNVCVLTLDKNKIKGNESVAVCWS